MSDAPFNRDCEGPNPQRRDQPLPRTARDGGAEIDRFFDALGDTRRRLVLLYLNRHDYADLEPLAEYIAEYEGGDTSDERVERVRIDLHHRQLPKLEEHGLLARDVRTNVVRLEPLPEAVERILDLTQDLEDVDDE